VLLNSIKENDFHCASEIWKNNGISVYIPKETILKESQQKLSKLSQHIFVDLVLELSNKPHTNLKSFIGEKIGQKDRNDHRMDALKKGTWKDVRRMKKGEKGTRAYITNEKTSCCTFIGHYISTYQASEVCITPLFPGTPYAVIVTSPKDLSETSVQSSKTYTT
jgi:hypothetical protein